MKKKFLRHEPLEDRHLLAVDLTGGMSGAMFPQEELAVISAPQASPQIAPVVVANFNETALIPNDIADSEIDTLELETDSALQAEIVPMFYGPITWEESEMYRLSLLNHGTLRNTIAPLDVSEWDTFFATTSSPTYSKSHSWLSDPSIALVGPSSIVEGADHYTTFEITWTGVEGAWSDSRIIYFNVNSPDSWFAPSAVTVEGPSGYMLSPNGQGQYAVGFASMSADSVRIRVYAHNDQIPDRETNFQVEIVSLSRSGTVNLNNMPTIFGAGGFWSVLAEDKVTVKDNDNWVVGSSVVDAVAFEPQFIPEIIANGGTADDIGIFRIHKYPGDENCTDSTYPITVEFALNLPKYNDPNIVLGAYGVDYTVEENANVFNIGGTWWYAIIPAGQDYIDVVIKALNDNDSDEELVFMDVTRAYSSQGFYENKFFKTGKTGGESVVIKDAGWGIKSIIWTKHATGNDLIGKWTGLSVYADSNVPRDPNDPNSMNENFRKVDVVVTVEGILPATGGRVNLGWIDPPNASGTGVNNYMNLGFNRTELVFYNNAMSDTVTTTVGINAGDNYIVWAYGGTTPRYAYSDILTVWRRLWVECDQMAMPGYNIDAGAGVVYFKTNERGKDIWDDVVPPDEGPNFDLRKQPDKPDISLLNTLLNQACVSAYEFTNNAVPVVDFVPNLTSDQIYYKHTSEIARQGNNRSVPEPNQVDQFYWTMYVLAAYEAFGCDHDNHYGAPPNIATGNGGCNFSNGINRGNAYVFCETIRDATHTHGKCPGVIKSEEDIVDDSEIYKLGPLADYNTFFKRVIAHEILHSFLGGHYDAKDPSSPSFTDQTVMNYEYIYANWDCSLNITQIAKIQFEIKPTPTS